MTINFRSRIPDIINHDIVLHQGICCTGNSRIGSTGEFGYHECFANNGQYFPYINSIVGSTGAIITSAIPTCQQRNPKNVT